MKVRVVLLLGVLMPIRFLMADADVLSRIMLLADPNERIGRLKEALAKGADINAQNREGETLLHQEINNSNASLQVIKYLVDAGVPIETKNNVEKMTPFTLAGWRGRGQEILEYLLEKGADINAQDREGQTLLHRAAFHPKAYPLVEFLLKRGADHAIKDNTGLTPLHMAMKMMNEWSAMYLIGYGADIYAKNNKGESPVDLYPPGGVAARVKFGMTKEDAMRFIRNEVLFDIVASKDSSDKILERLKEAINNGAYINAKGPRGDTILHRASWRGDLKLVKYLLEEATADVNIKDSEDNTPLHLASVRGNLDVIKYLVEKGAKANAENMTGETPAHLVVDSGNLDAVKFFVEEAHIDIDKQDGGDLSLVSLGVLAGRADIVEYLAEKGANLSQVDRYGRSLVHNAVRVGSLETLAYLVEKKGADINKGDNSNSVALHFAPNRQIAEYLIGKGANVNAVNRFKESPLHSASQENRLDVIEVLINEGGDVNAKDENSKTPLDIASKDEVKAYLVAAKKGVSGGLGHEMSEKELKDAESALFNFAQSLCQLVS